MQPSSKKSSIPRAGHCNLNRPDADLTKSKFGVRHQQQHYQPKPNRRVPLAEEGLIPENDDAVRESLLSLESDHMRRKQELEAAVQEAEGRLEIMKKLMEERERLMAANMKAAGERTADLEKQVEKQEKTLLENNIDPVTGEVIRSTSEQSRAVEKVKKISKEDVARMREKLHQMNENSDKYLTDIQGMLKGIKEVEGSSERASASSASQLTQEEMKRVIREMEDAERAAQKSGAAAGDVEPLGKDFASPSASEVFLTETA